MQPFDDAWRACIEGPLYADMDSSWRAPQPGLCRHPRSASCPTWMYVGAPCTRERVLTRVSTWDRRAELMRPVAPAVGSAVLDYAEGGVKLCKYVDNRAICLSSGLNIAPTVRRSIQRILALNIKEVCSA